MKKRIVSLLLVLVMILTMAACGGNGTTATEAGSNEQNDSPAVNSGDSETTPPAEELADEQVFYYYTGTEPSPLNPWMNSAGDASIISAAIHEPMLRPSLEGEGWLPGLCSDYQMSDDSKVHTLTLREGAKWQDGTDITIDDIYNSYLRVLDAEYGSSRAYQYFDILNAEAYYNGEATVDELGIKVIDDHTIEFTTENPCDFFVDMMTSDGFAPIQTAAGDEYGELYGTDVDKLVASGPFKMTEWVHNHTIVLEKNENYWDAENVILERLEITITSDSNTIMGMF